ncbi:MAG: HpsJ family protein [Synechococcus sp.]|nr:HpsJ family protein [Synechococcus sp.]
MNNARLASFTSLSLKVLGAILLISSLVDYIIAAFPWMPMDNAWQINFTNQVVGQGINPLLGIVALLLSNWLDLSTGKPGQLRASITDSRFLSFIFSLILGAIFLLLIPLHLDNMQGIREEAIARIEQETQQREAQVQDQYSQLQALAQTPEAKKQIEEQLKRIDEALNSGQVPPQQIAQIEAQKQQLQNYQKFVDDPAALNARLEELQQSVVDLQTKQRQEANRTVLQEVVRTSVRSLLLGIGYLIVGWLGIQNARHNKLTSPQVENTPESTVDTE